MKKFLTKKYYIFAIINKRFEVIFEKNLKMNIDTYQKNGWIKIRSFIKPYEIKEIRNKIDNFLKKI